MSRKRKKRTKSRRRALGLSLASTVALALWTVLSVWFVHHPRKWLERKEAAWPSLLTAALYCTGNPVGDLTDAFGWTGHDAVYEYDEPAPAGAVAFAGFPRRTGAPAPNDIVVLDRGEFAIGWSPRLRHPVWCAYHVPAKAKHEASKRPNFTRDPAVPSSPPSSVYTHTFYDRGHFAPNFAVATRFGPEAQRKTFLTTNIVPQSPALNRGVWREMEHRIAELWTARWGEIWVVVGCLSEGQEVLSGTDIDVPTRFYQIVVAQDGLDIRALAVLFDQEMPWSSWPTRYLVSIDELEELSGLDFLPDLPAFIQTPLEAELPSRLWPIRPIDAFRQLMLRFP